MRFIRRNIQQKLTLQDSDSKKFGGLSSEDLLHLRLSIWRLVRVAEGASLERMYTGNCIESSNLSVSAE
jgi:hypothetical protein